MDIVKEELARIVYNYSANHKIADQHFCERIASILAVVFNVKEYYQGLIFSNRKSVTTASYCAVNKKITINLDYYKNDFLKNVDLSCFDANSFNYYYYINSSIMQTLVHEMTHAYQFKMVYKDNTKGIEKNLYVAAFKIYNYLEEAIINSDVDLIEPSKMDPFYFKTYNNDRLYYYSLPTERIAFINAAHVGYDVTKVATDDKVLNKIAENDFIDRSFLGYADYAPSSYVFAVNTSHENPDAYTNSIDALEKIEGSLYAASVDNGLSFDNRIMFGLPLSQEEKEEHKENIENSKSFIIKQQEFTDELIRRKKAI